MITTNDYNTKTKRQNCIAQKARIKGNNLTSLTYVTNVLLESHQIQYWASYLKIPKCLHKLKIPAKDVHSPLISFLILQDHVFGKGWGRQRGFWWYCGRQKHGFSLKISTSQSSEPVTMLPYTAKGLSVLIQLRTLILQLRIKRLRWTIWVGPGQSQDSQDGRGNQKRRSEWWDVRGTQQPTVADSENGGRSQEPRSAGSS